MNGVSLCSSDPVDRYSGAGNDLRSGQATKTACIMLTWAPIIDLRAGDPESRLLEA